jgi:RNA polymerase sigma factor (sigma-70 family)
LANGTSATETRHLRTLFALGAAGDLTDGQLLERFATLDGDPAELAFAALVDRHGPMVLRVARSTLVDEHSTHDVFQATFLILARKGRSLWVRDSLGPWLHRVAYRVAAQSRAAEARRRRFEKGAARPEVYQPREQDRSDLVQAIHQEIERLPEPYRLAVVTCHLEGLTQHEAANRLGWPVGTLQSRLARGRRTLRDRLQRRGLAPSLAALAAKVPPVSNALTASTARAALSLSLGESAAGVIAPAVFALIKTTTKGVLMTKWKLAALALAMACGLVGSGVVLGRGWPVQATDDPPVAKKVEPGRADSPPVVGPGSNRSVVIEEVDDGGGKRSRSVVVEDMDGDGKLDVIVPTPNSIEPGSIIPNSEPPEPSLTDRYLPRPWESVVRIKMHLSEKEWGFGSGTVIFSTPEESIILTCAHSFRTKRSKQPSPKDFKVPISVDLFGGEFVREQPATLACLERDIPGEVIDYDFTNDVGLIRIWPGRKIPASRVVPTYWAPNKSMVMTTAGCSHGNDATVWSTKVLDPHVNMNNSSTKQSFATIKCANQPKEGRSGGGLYTSDGYLAGVCLFADPNEHTGLYAVPEAIHNLLDRNGLAALYGKEVDDEDARPSASLDLESLPPAITTRTADEKPARKRLVPEPVGSQGFPTLLFFLDTDAIRQHLSNDILILLRQGYPIKLVDYDESPDLAKKYEIIALPTIVLVDGKGSAIAELKGNMKALQIARFYNLNGMKSAQRPSDEPADDQPRMKSTAPAKRPATSSAVSDQERRLDEQERKLDQVLKALDDLKGNKPPIDRKGGLGP